MIAAKKLQQTQLVELRASIISRYVLGEKRKTSKRYIHPWVGQVPEAWKVTKLAHVAQIKTGGTPSKDNLTYWEGGTIPWLASGEVNKGIIDHADSFITELGMANSNTVMLPENTVMIALNGQGKTKGMAAILKSPATCNQSLAGIVCNQSKICPTYLYYYLKCKYSSIRGLKGEARDGLNLDLIGSIAVPLPSLPEQQAIAELIRQRETVTDSIKNKLKESINLLEEYRSSLISNVVSGKVKI
jgi:type I restriction enzyme S subunit